MEYIESRNRHFRPLNYNLAQVTLSQA